MARSGFPALVERLNDRMDEQDAMESAIWLFFVAEQLEETDKKGAVSGTVVRLRHIAELLGSGNAHDEAHEALDVMEALEKEADYASSRDFRVWLRDTIELLDRMLPPRQLHSFVQRLRECEKWAAELTEAAKTSVSQETHRELLSEVEEERDELKKTIEELQANIATLKSNQGPLEDQSRCLELLLNRKAAEALFDTLEGFETATADEQRRFADLLSRFLGDHTGDVSSPVRRAMLAAVNAGLADGHIKLERKNA